jgi:hypothetical protein
MEKIYYRISQFSKILIYAMYRLKSFFKARKVVTETDYKNLNIMFKYFMKKYPYNTNLSFLLFYAEIRRAKKIRTCDMADDVIKIDSVVTFKKILTDENLTIRLVYPNREQLSTLELSVFSAVGMALFAQKSGTTVSCFEAKRKIHLKILSIV